jgi:hypothetical protein
MSAGLAPAAIDLDAHSQVFKVLGLPKVISRIPVLE